MNQNQIDALGSLIFNIGCQGSRFYLDRESGRFKKTQLYKAAIDKDFIRMCNTFPNYSRVNGKVHKSILKRRLRERDLCLSPVNKVQLLCAWLAGAVIGAIKSDGESVNKRA